MAVGSWLTQAQGIPADGAPIRVVSRSAFLPFLIAESQHFVGHSRLEGGVGQAIGLLPQQVDPLITLAPPDGGHRGGWFMPLQAGLSFTLRFRYFQRTHPQLQLVP